MPKIVPLRSKTFGPNSLLRIGTMFGPNIIPNRKSNWMCRRLHREDCHSVVGGNERISSGPNFFLRSSRIRVVRQQYQSNTTGRRGKKLDGFVFFFSLDPCVFWWHYYIDFSCPNLFCLCHCIAVGLLSYDSRMTLIRLDRRKKYGRVPRWVRCVTVPPTWGYRTPLAA